MLVVILIIGLVSVLALPTVMSAMGHREVSEAARIIQGALVGARDNAIHTNAPSGIRLLPDPTFSGIGLALLADGVTPNPFAGIMDPSQILAFNRLIPLDPAPEYSEGFVSVYPKAVYPNTIHNPAGLNLPTPTLVLEQAVLSSIAIPGSKPPTFVPNSPTSWMWNVRIGDKVQIKQAGAWYTVVGPMWTSNPEMFVNVGLPGATLPILTQGVTAEYLLLVDGRDNNNNGWVDEGYDGVDNDGNGLIDETSSKTSPQLGEWLETEAWQGAMATGAVDQSYTIQRRPMPSVASREIALPTGVVIDMTTWGTSRERSRIPTSMFNLQNGYVDIMINPDGTVLASTTYSSPTSFDMGSAFIHFWLADRRDLVGPPITSQNQPTSLVANQPIYLPIGDFSSLYQTRYHIEPAAYVGPRLQGDCAIMTLGKSGLVTVNDNPEFDDPMQPLSTLLPVQPGGSVPAPQYEPSLPFQPGQQGVSSF